MTIMILCDEQNAARAAALFWKLKGAESGTQLALCENPAPGLVLYTLKEERPTVVGVLSEPLRTTWANELIRLGYEVHAPTMHSHIAQGLAQPKPRGLMGDPLAVDAQAVERFLGLPAGKLASCALVDSAMSEIASMTTQERNHWIVQADLVPEPRSRERQANHARVRDRSRRDADVAKELARYPMAKAKVIFASTAAGEPSSKKQELRVAVSDAINELRNSPSRTMAIEALAGKIGKSVTFIKKELVPSAADYSQYYGLSFLDDQRYVALCDLAKSAIQTLSADKKTTIGNYCAMHLVQSGDTIILDGGTSTLAVFKSICHRVRAGQLSNLRIITNSNKVFQQPDVAGSLPIKVFSTGGEFFEDYDVFRGEQMRQTLASMANALSSESGDGPAHKRRLVAFVGTTVVGPTGCGVRTEVELESKRLICRLAQAAYTPVDSTKFGDTDGEFVFARHSERKLALVTDYLTNDERPSYVEVEAKPKLALVGSTNAQSNE